MDRANRGKASASATKMRSWPFRTNGSAVETALKSRRGRIPKTGSNSRGMYRTQGEIPMLKKSRVSGCLPNSHSLSTAELVNVPASLLVWAWLGAVFSAQHHNTPSQRHRRGLGAVVDAQLAQDTVHVVFDRAFGNGQSRGDFFVAQAFDDQLENVQFAGAQF